MNPDEYAKLNAACEVSQDRADETNEARAGRVHSTYLTWRLRVIAEKLADHNLDKATLRDAADRLNENESREVEARREVAALKRQRDHLQARIQLAQFALVANAPEVKLEGDPS